MVLSESEIKALIKVVRKAIRKDPLYMPNYAILLALYTGLRVGELAALPWDSIRDGLLHIDYSEHRLDYDDRPSEIIIGEPKNKKHRKFPVTDEIKALLDEIKAIQEKHGIKAEYVIQDSKKRYTASQISNCMRHRCITAGIPNKSIHDIRRTVSSKLRTTLPRATVAALMGHLEETNENHYNYDVTTMEIKIKALSSLWSDIPKNVTECNPKIKEFSEIKNKRETADIIPFPA